jgi:hypothetical protein
MAQGLSGEHLSAALAAVAKLPPPGSQQGPPPTGQTDPNAPAGPGGGSPPQDPNAAAQDPNAPQDPNAQQDPNQQAVWQEFPATDPTQIEQLVQALQGAGPDQQVQMLGSFMQQADADRQKLDQMHEAMLSHLLELVQGPGGAPQDQGQGSDQGVPPPQGPGVGGQGTGY